MRDRCLGLRKISGATIALLLVLSACSGDDESVETSSTTSSTTAAATVSSSSVPPESSTTTTTAVPALPVAGIGETVLVVADDGVYQIDAEGDVTLLVAGRVTYAVDDTRGGLLFQVDRGRNSGDEHRSSTIVWWIPRGASRPQELLVPTPGTDNSLSLHDAYATDDGFAVLYTSHEGSTPDVDDIIDRLRRFDVPARSETELHSQGAFEAGFGEVSTNGELIAGVLYGQVGSGCFIYDLDGQPTDLVPSVRSDLDLTSDDYVGGCRLSPDGNRLVFETEQYEANTLASTTLHVWGLVAGTEATRFAIPRRAGVADVSVTRLMATVTDDDGLQALVFDLNAPEQDPVALPIPGMARFVETAVEIGAPVHVGARPNYYRYGDDGLYRVVDDVETQLSEDSVFWAYDDLMGGVIYRLHWQLDAETTYWLRADGSTDTLAYHPQFVAAIDGEQTAVTFISAADVDRDMLLVGLLSGSESRVPNIGFDGDGWSFPRSYGEGLFVGVDGAAVGCGYSDAVISFWDGDGNRIDHPHNPVAEPCGPCELSAAVSPDGRLLAYSHRADSSSEYHGRLVCGGHDDWWNETQEILAEAVVLDLGTGDEVFRVTAPARASVADFDGRYVVVDQGDWVEDKRRATIYDTWGIHEPVEVDGGVALIRQSMTRAAGITLRADGLGIVSFGEPADLVLNTMMSIFGPPDTEEFVDPVAEQVTMPQGLAANRYFRFASWDQIGLYIVLSDSNYFRDDGQPHFVGWGVTRPGWETEAGIGVGSTVAEVLGAYGEDVALPDSGDHGCDALWAFRLGEPIPPDTADHVHSMHGELDGDSSDPSTRVTSLRGGAMSSC